MTDPTPQSEFLPSGPLTAAGSGREIDLRRLGVPSIIVFHGQDTADTALEVNKAVRRDHPGTDEILIASVIDLRPFPKMFHGMVKPALEKAYFTAASKVPEGADPADLVILLPDWDGAVHEAVGVRDSTREAALALVDAEARILRLEQGPPLADKAVAGLTDLLGS